MHLREKQGSAQGNHRRHLPRSARVQEDQDEESVCSEKNQGSQRKRTAPGEKGKDQHHRTEGIHRDSHVYKRHRPIPSRTELAGQRQQSWKSVERWPPRIASEPLRYVAMPEISPGYSTSKLAICSVEGLLAQLWPADWVPAATAGVGRSLRARCQPMQCRGFAARGDHGGSQKCHRSDNPCAAAPHRGPPDLTRARRRALLSLVARRES